MEVGDFDEFCKRVAEKIIELLAKDKMEIRSISISNPIRPKPDSCNTETVQGGVQSKTLPKIAQLWNEHAGQEFSRVKAMSSGSQRYRSCNARWRENPQESHWIDIINKVNQSDFLSGNNSSNWKATLDFVVRPDKGYEILEGKYDNRGGNKPKLPPPTPTADLLKVLDEFGEN